MKELGIKIKSCVLIIDPRCRINQNDWNVIYRHKKYAEALSRNSSDSTLSLIVLQPTSSGSQSLDKISDNFSILKIRMPLKRVIFSPAQIISALEDLRIDPQVLVAGDPDVSFLNTFLLQRKYQNIRSKKIPIQVQVHSELSRSYAKSGLGQFVKYYCAKISLKLADSIRSTSPTHTKILASNFGIKISKISAIPVPLSIDLDQIVIHSRNRPFSLGFIGRLQKERNLELLVQIVTVLAVRIPNIQIVIVGDGKEKTSLQDALHRVAPSSRVRFLGHVDRAALNIAWAQIGVLVSTAKNESYGRSIRESLCHGIPVIAHDSLGLSSLLEEVEQNWIWTIKFPINGDEIAQQFLRLVKLETNDAYLNYQKSLQLSLYDDLANSWIRTNV